MTQTITAVLRQNNATASFWRNNGVIIVLYVNREYVKEHHMS